MSGITNNALYTTYLLRPSFRDEYGSLRQGGWGTGFGVELRGVFIIVTARHVLDRAFEDAKYKGWTLESIDLEAKELDATTLLPKGELRARLVRFRTFFPDDNVTDIAFLAQMETHDRAPLRVHPFPSGIIADSAHMASLTIGDAIGIIGYPDGHDTANGRPILRGGIIASDPRLPYAVDGADRGAVIAYEGFSFGGASGAPVLSFQQGSVLVPDTVFRMVKLIGVNAGHLWAASPDRIHSGISYFYRIDCLIGLVEKVFAATGS